MDELGAGSQGFLVRVFTSGCKRAIILAAAEFGIWTSEWTRLQLDLHSLVMWKWKQACIGKVPTVVQRLLYKIGGANSKLAILFMRSLAGVKPW